MDDLPKPVAIVLAGGQGLRMGAVDKGLEPVLGKPLVMHVLERIRPQVAEVYISANRSFERYRAFGYPVIPDVSPAFPGPLEGVRSVLRKLTQPLWISVPCDVPCIPMDLVVRLQSGLWSAGADLAVPEIAGAIERAVCLGRLELLGSLEAFLASGKRRVGEWQHNLNTLYVPFDDARDFVNVNDRLVLQEVENRMISPRTCKNSP